MKKQLYKRFPPLLNSNAAKSWGEMGVKNIIVYTCGDELTCEACKSFNEKVMSVKAAQNPNNVPPWPSCTCKQGCRCYIKPLVDVKDL